MEGLIPSIVRAIKRRKSHRYYQCLSSGAAQRLDASADSHENGHVLLLPPLPPADKLRSFHDEDRKAHRRRHRSMEDVSGREVFTPEEDFREQPRLAKDVRFGSHRMLACIAGA